MGVAMATMAVGVASADNIIAYSFIVTFTPTDITNIQALVPGWCPGCNLSAQDTVASGAEPAAYGVTATATGVTMASLNAAHTIYTLQGYDIRATSTITGNFTITNAANSSSNANGTAKLDSYTAVSLGSPLSPALSNTLDSANDLFNNGHLPGWGPDPASSTITINNLAAGASQTGTFANVVQSADVGCDFFPDTTNAPCAVYNEITPPNSLAGINVQTTNGANDFLTFFFSTATEVNSSLTGGNTSTANQTQVKERITVTYDYTTALTPSVPEPMTMVLMGGALVGLGVLGKKLKKS